MKIGESDQTSDLLRESLELVLRQIQLRQVLQLTNFLQKSRDIYTACLMLMVKCGKHLHRKIHYVSPSLQSTQFPCSTCSSIFRRAMVPSFRPEKISHSHQKKKQENTVWPPFVKALVDKIWPPLCNPKYIFVYMGWRPHKS